MRLLDHNHGDWFERDASSFSSMTAGQTSEIQRNIIVPRVLGLHRG